MKPERTANGTSREEAYNDYLIVADEKLEVYRAAQSQAWAAYLDAKRQAWSDFQAAKRQAWTDYLAVENTSKG